MLHSKLVVKDDILDKMGTSGWFSSAFWSRISAVRGDVSMMLVPRAMVICPGSKDLGPRHWVQRAGSKELGPRGWVQGAGNKGMGLRGRVQGGGYKVVGLRVRVSGAAR